MRIKIRRGCFESNSSSMHSINIMKQNRFITKESFDNDDNEYLYINKNGILDFTYDEDDFYFERGPFRVLCSFREKLMFTIASFCGNYKSDAKKRFKEIFKIAQEINPNIKEIKMPKDYYNEDEIFYGNIDHQSVGLLQNFLSSHNLTIKDFLSNGKYIVIIDGDEYYFYDNLKKSGLINIDNIEEEFMV